MAKGSRPRKNSARDFAARFGAEKSATNLVVLFIPSRSRVDEPIDRNTMATNIRKIAKAMGAEIVGEIPETGGGAFGAARMSRIVSQLSHRLKPGRGLRPGRPTNPNWARHS